MVTSRFTEYVVAVFVTALAAALVFLLERVGYFGLSPLMGAVVISAWYGGAGPGAISLIFSSVLAYRLLPHHETAGPDQVDLLRTAVFAVVALLASALHFVTHRARELAERARDAAEEASATKTRFLAMVSHELRNPMGIVLMAVAKAEADPVVAERSKSELASIRRNVALQVKLIDDLVDLAGISHGKIRLTLSDIDLHAPLKAAIQNCQEGIAEKHLALQVRFDAEQIHVAGDPDRLQQIFRNLLRNAIKFTPPNGSITISTSNDRTGWIRIEFTDSGIGIEPGRLSKIFTAFEQGGENITRQFGGLGLGLSICGALTQAHGGSVTAGSAGLGRGATFTVQIPLIAATPMLPPRVAQSTGLVGSHGAC